MNTGYVKEYTDNERHLIWKGMFCTVTTVPITWQVELQPTFITYVEILQQHMHNSAG
jgi:hypothetical protein